MSYIIKKSLVSNLLFFFAIILRINSETTANLSYFFLLIACFFGPRQIITSLILIWFFSSLNSQIAPIANYSVIFRFFFLILVFLMLISIYSKKIFFYNKAVNINLFFFCLFIVIHSFLLSQIPDVSILKTVNWFLYFFILLTCWSIIDKNEYLKLLKSILIILLIMVIFSLFFLKTEIGFIKNGDSFQGILNHPQLFGLVMGLTAITICNFQDLKFFSSKVSFIFIIITIYFLMLSESRTAIFGFIGGYLIYLATKKEFKYIKKKSIKLSKIIITLFFFIFLLFLIYKLNNYFYIEFINDILTKSDRLTNESFLELYTQTRGEPILASYDNILQKFWSGIGFGIASNPEQMLIIRDEYFDIPYNAPTEKGNIFIATLEEIGFFGFVFFIIFLFTCLKSALVSRFNFISIFFIVLFFNLGESSFFSTAGVGGLLSIFFTMSIAYKNTNN